MAVYTMKWSIRPPILLSILLTVCKLSPLDLQKVGWKAEAFPASVLFLHRFEQCGQTCERRSLKQHGAPQYPLCPPGQLCFPKPHTQTTAYLWHTEDTLTADPAHGESQQRTFFTLGAWALFQLIKLISPLNGYSSTVAQQGFKNVISIHSSIYQPVFLCFLPPSAVAILLYLWC